MNKPRNWYIHQWEDLAQADFAWRNEEVLNRELEIHTKYVNMGYRPKGEVIEVVEKSAYDQIKHEFKMLQSCAFRQEKRIKLLEEVCGELMEALEHYEDVPIWKFAGVDTTGPEPEEIEDEEYVAFDALESAKKKLEE